MKVYSCVVVSAIYALAARPSGHAEIRALVPDDRPLPRSAAVLRWSPVEEGARYTVELSLPDHTSLHTASELTATELAIPQQVLSRIPTGGSLEWHVSARLADGSLVESPAFRHRLDGEPAGETGFGRGWSVSLAVAAAVLALVALRRLSARARG
jgi:hypothetical protein